MKTTTTTHTIAVISVLTLGLLSSASAMADTVKSANALIYNSHAAIYAINDAPNPVADQTIPNAEIVYVDTAYGPAIYSYPSNRSFQHTAFNVEYVDTAYGPALYSYPTHQVKHRLSLVDNTNLDNRFIVPASFSGNNSSVRTAEIFH